MKAFLLLFFSLGSYLNYYIIAAQKRMISPLSTGNPAAQEKIRYLGLCSPNLTVYISIVKDTLFLKIISMRSSYAIGKMRAHFVLSIISYRTHSNRNSFTPLSGHAQVFITQARRLYNVAKALKRHSSVLELVTTSRSSVQIYPRWRATIASTHAN